MHCFPIQYINFKPWTQLYCKSWTPVPELCPSLLSTPHLLISSPPIFPSSVLSFCLLSHHLSFHILSTGLLSPLLCPVLSSLSLSSHAPLSMVVADSDFASKMKNRQMGSSGGMNMTKSTSISGDMCNLEKTDGSQSDTAVGTVGTDDKKRRSSIGAKMQAMVGMSRKSRSTSQLSQTGRECQCTGYMFICASVLCSVCVGFSVVLCAECCSNTTALFLSPTFNLKGLWTHNRSTLPHTFFSLSFRSQL